MNHLYLDRPQLRAVAELLREIPELAEDLTIARTRQARTGSRDGHRAHRRPGEQPLPYDPAAARAADDLHAVLVSWVRLVCEQRAVDYTGSPTTAGLARWLDRNLIALAMTEGAHDAPDDLRRVVHAANLVVCPPAAPTVDLDETALTRARAQRLNASGIAALAKALGDEYRTLTVRRVQTLRDAGRISPVPGPWSLDWPELFLVGQVLDEHLTYPTRKRRPALAS
ncbi:hypothetical protein ACTD5D_03860 [Nocardia takedensis]|uniref:hypothetical protein n=1 Tax=Nocardia takedensis TaxID=259390 RepID=UPI0002EF102B|nr:hypothetical protein [Nocardia takedensis]